MKALHFILLTCLCFGSLAHSAMVYLVTEGSITQTSSVDYPFVVAGDQFRLTVSYSDHFLDTDADPILGVYLPTDLTIILEIIGKGIAFESIGGSVNVWAGTDFPIYSIFSKSKPNGHSLFLTFTETERSHAPLFKDGIPKDFGQFSDYEYVGFSIVDFPDPYEMVPQLHPYPIPINPMVGSVTGFIVPEPGVALISGLAFALIGLRRRRMQEVE